MFVCVCVCVCVFGCLGVHGWLGVCNTWGRGLGMVYELMKNINEYRSNHLTVGYHVLVVIFSSSLFL